MYNSFVLCLNSPLELLLFYQFKQLAGHLIYVTYYKIHEYIFFFFHFYSF